jgi:hypothetical protein
MWHKLLASITKTRFFLRELAAAWSGPRKGMRILFSVKPKWQRAISFGFSLSPYKVMFAEFAPAVLDGKDLIVPLTIDDAKTLNGHAKLLADSLIPVAENHVIELCDDKVQLNAALIAAGFGQYVPEMGTDIAFPWILKKRIDEWGANSRIICDAQQAQMYAELISDPHYFCQSVVVATREYATHILIRGGRIVHALNIEYVFAADFYIKGKNRPICKTISPCPYLELFTDILNAIGYNGLCCINYKVQDNRPLLLEINPRFGGSLSAFFFSFMRRL